MRRAARLLLACAVAMAAGASAAQNYRSVGETAAILYDAPSVKAKRLYVVSRGYPLEVAVVLEGWTKVRDAAGEYSWIESRALNERRTVVVRVANAPVRQSADDGSAIVFQARQNVVLELLEGAANGWLHVRHQDGPSGFVRATLVWGA